MNLKTKNIKFFLVISSLKKFNKQFIEIKNVGNVNKL